MITKAQSYKIQELSRIICQYEVAYTIAKTRTEQDNAVKALQSANKEFSEYLKTITEV